ncbi:MAG: 4-(cytidine 5'-diphospho)-2-C-methyl-D-erythritol kinase [Bacteroidetes bacterium 4484_249]|nr:MAG: 4-(cytidine 5'-diphospho)-2-C-methyl-D-erythritol kinase [Bacteroidetes bacterium 4484_249]
MICFPNCKINLGLSVIEKRQDGFHNVETVMYPVKMNDILEIVISNDKKTTFKLSGFNVSGKRENNLVVRAYELLKKDFNLEPVKIHLHKSIPSGAGLGGGSADAAFTIKLLNDIFDLKLTVNQMQDYARRLGSDCPFFIENKPVLTFEKGDKFENIIIDLSKYYFVIIKPDINISTPAAYSWVKPLAKKTSLAEIITQPVESWKENLFNDFEGPVFSRFPEIKKIKEDLYRLGAVYASMTGSGAAVYGIFSNRISIEENFKGCFVWQK